MPQIPTPEIRWWQFHLWVFFGIICFFHFFICLTVMVCYRTDKKRVEAYSFYHPWGWGKLELPDVNKLMYDMGNRDGLAGLNPSSTSSEYLRGFVDGRRKRIEKKVNS